MKFAGIIAEYDPFHNGHAWQLAQAKALGAERVAVAMSCSLVQRGALPLLPEAVRTRFHPSSGDKATVLPAEPVPTKSYPHSHRKYRLHLHIRTHRTFSEKPENPNRFLPKQ